MTATRRNTQKWFRERERRKAAFAIDEKTAWRVLQDALRKLSWRAR